MARSDERQSPAGRPIRILAPTRVTPTWLTRRRQAYRLIDLAADGAKRSVRRWLVPRPRGFVRAGGDPAAAT